MIKKSLAISDVVQILENTNDYDCISAPPVKPKANQVFLYKTDDAAKEGTRKFIISNFGGYKLMLKTQISVFYNQK